MNVKYILSILFLSFLTMNNTAYQKRDCLAVPPGGFSGFWYSLSQLKQNKTSNEKYFCASSGCLAVICNYIDVYKVYDFALLSRNNNKSLSYMKNVFINLLLKKINFVPNINIVTMSKYGTCIERTPKDKNQLKTLLIKTTDIPFIFSTHGEVAGGLCYYYHNKCKKSITLPITYRFVRNLLNYNINLDDIIYFYNYI